MSIFLESVKSFKWPKEEMDLLSFEGLLCLYLILTVILFVISSGGWSMFLMFFGWGFIAAVLAIVSLLAAAVWSFVYKQKTVLVDKRWVLFLVMTQFVTVMLNSGDNGDVGGSYIFIERLLDGAGFHRIINSSLVSQLSQFSLLLHLLYLALLITFVFLTFFKSRKVKQNVKTEAAGRKLSHFGKLLGAVLVGLAVVVIVIQACIDGSSMYSLALNVFFVFFSAGTSVGHSLHFL